MRPLVSVRVGRGRRYEIVTCWRLNGLEEKLRRVLEEYCRAGSGRGVSVLAFFIVRDGGGGVAKVWSLEVHDSLYGPVVYLGDPLGT